jgi:transposase
MPTMTTMMRKLRVRATLRISGKEASMLITERAHGDIAQLRKLVRKERDSRKRDRLRAALLALEGKEACEIAEMLARSRRGVQDWVYLYRDGGIDALAPKPQPGRKTKLSSEREAEFKVRFAAGPKPEDGVCTLRGKDAVRILKQEFGVQYSLDGAYCLLHRLGLTSLRPRPRHEKQDPAKQQEFRERAPLLSPA